MRRSLETRWSHYKMRTKFLVATVIVALQAFLLTGTASAQTYQAGAVAAASVDGCVTVSGINSADFAGDITITANGATIYEGAAPADGSVEICGAVTAPGDIIQVIGAAGDGSPLAAATQKVDATPATPTPIPVSTSGTGASAPAAAVVSSISTGPLVVSANTAAAATAPNASGASALAVTGSEAAPLVIVGAGMVLAGAAAVAVSRRRDEA